MAFTIFGNLGKRREPESETRDDKESEEMGGGEIMRSCPHTNYPCDLPICQKESCMNFRNHAKRDFGMVSEVSQVSNLHFMRYGPQPEERVIISKDHGQIQISTERHGESRPQNLMLEIHLLLETALMLYNRHITDKPNTLDSLFFKSSLEQTERLAKRIVEGK